MTRRTISSALEKRVGDVADQDFVALPEDMLVGVAVKIMRNRDVSSILVSKLMKNKGNSYNHAYSRSYDSSPQSWHHPVLSKETAIGILTERDILYRVMAENDRAKYLNENIRCHELIRMYLNFCLLSKNIARPYEDQRIQSLISWPYPL